MQRKLALALLLLSSANLYAQQTLNPLAHGSYVFSSNGKPVLSGNGHCVRTSLFTTQGEPDCYIQPKVATAEAEAPTVNVTPDTVSEVVAEKVAPATPKTEPETTTTSIEPEPATIIEPTIVQTTSAEPAVVEPAIVEQTIAEPQAITYSYVTETIDTHIYFDFDKNNLRIAEQEKLEYAIIEAMQANKLFKVSVEGHADSRGTDAYNVDLSQRRVNTVINYLNLRGINTNSTMAWGESKLIMNADGSEDYDSSRRAEVIFKVQKKIKD